MYLKSLDHCLKNKMMQIEADKLDNFEDRGAVLHVFGKEKIVDTLFCNLKKEMEICTCEEAVHYSRKEMWVPLDLPIEKLKAVAEYVNTFNNDRKNKVLCEVYPL